MEHRNGRAMARIGPNGAGGSDGSRGCRRRGVRPRGATRFEDGIRPRGTKTGERRASGRSSKRGLGNDLFSQVWYECGESNECYDSENAPLLENAEECVILSVPGARTTVHVPLEVETGIDTDTSVQGGAITIDYGGDETSLTCGHE